MRISHRHVSLVAILAIAALEVVALAIGFNGQVHTATVAGIAGIAGYNLHAARKE